MGPLQLGVNVGVEEHGEGWREVALAVLLSVDVDPVEDALVEHASH